MAGPTPITTRALVSTSSANPLTISTVPLKNTPLSPNEILIRVHAASINPVDIQLWKSGLVDILTRLGLFSEQKGVGKDFSGVVVKVGTGVTGFNSGEEVWGFLSEVGNQGTISDYITVDPVKDPVVKKPACLSHEEAASIPLVALTAFACLEWLPTPAHAASPRRRVIVRGASGGTGVWAVQLAKKLYNCHVTAICSGRNEEFVRDLGADEVINYTTTPYIPTLLSQKPQGTKYDLFVDCVGGDEVFPHLDELLHPYASYVTIVGSKTSRTTMGGPITYLTHPSQIYRYIRGYIFGPRYGCILLQQNAEWLNQIIGLVERGDVKPIVQEVVKSVLDERVEGGQRWRRLVELMEDGRVRGKIVVSLVD